MLSIVIVNVKKDVFWLTKVSYSNSLSSPRNTATTTQRCPSPSRAHTSKSQKYKGLFPITNQLKNLFLECFQVPIVSPTPPPMYQNSHTPDSRPPTEPLDPIQVNNIALECLRKILSFYDCWNALYCFSFHLRSLNDILMLLKLLSRKTPLSISGCGFFTKQQTVPIIIDRRGYLDGACTIGWCLSFALFS